MTPSIEPASKVKMGDLTILTSDIRAFVDEKDSSAVLLQNGMRIAITEEMRKDLMNALRSDARKIVSQVKTRGLL